MAWEQLGIFEWGSEIEENSTENDINLSSLTIETPNEDTRNHERERLNVPDESISIEFNNQVNLEFYETIDKEYKDVEELLQYLPVPGLIRELVRNCVRPVKDEILEWIYHDVKFIPKSLEISDLMFCVWLSEGKIDQRRTALNILSSCKMDIFSSFKFMCEYCLEEEIKNLPPDSIPKRLFRRITFDKNPLQYYWFCYMNDDLDKLRKRRGESIEAFLITSDYVNTGSAIEYFWDRLSINEQISKVSMLLSLKPQFQRQLFAKMNQFQKYHILSTAPFNIIMNFWNEKLYELVFQTWVRFGNVLTQEQFMKLLSKFVNCLPKTDEKINCLVKIWNHCSDDYKNQALQSMTDEVIEAFTVLRLFYNLDFLYVFLSWGSVEFRRNIMLRRGDEIVICNVVSSTDPLIRLCIPDSNDLVIFENLLLRSFHVERHCLTVLEGLYDGLDELGNFLNRFISNSDDRIKLIQKTIVSATIDNRSYCFDRMKRWFAAIELIEKYFHCPPHKIIKYKRRIVWSFVNFHAQCKYDYNMIHPFIEVITRVLGDDGLKMYKNLALRRFQRQYHWDRFDEAEIHQFLLWCLNDDHVEMRLFAKSLSIDSIFLRAWEEMNWDMFFDNEQTREEVTKRFAPVDRMLLWYFETPDRVKEYKLKKVFGYRNSRPAMFVKQNNQVDEIFVRNVLSWFFDGDREEICKFKEMFKDDEISKMIDIE
ncbi:hypothetical protein U1Q18_044681 [Sarracenia purpurea var. burkii]